MYRTISATEARAQFDEIMAEAVAHRQPILVEQDGKPQVVLLAADE